MEHKPHILSNGKRELPALTESGFLPDPPDYRSSEWVYSYPPGVTVNGFDKWLHIEVIATFDHDYMGVHYFVQAWDYRCQDDPDQRWQYMMLFRCSENGWRTRVVHEFEDHPNFAEVGRLVDEYRECPEALRFMLR